MFVLPHNPPTASTTKHNLADDMQSIAYQCTAQVSSRVLCVLSYISVHCRHSRAKARPHNTALQHLLRQSLTVNHTHATSSSSSSKPSSNAAPLGPNTHLRQSPRSARRTKRSIAGGILQPLLLRDGPSKRKVAPCFRSKFDGKNGMWNRSSFVRLHNRIGSINNGLVG